MIKVSGVVQSWGNVSLNAVGNIGGDVDNNIIPLLVYAGHGYSVNANSTSGSVYLSSAEILTADKISIYNSNSSFAGYDSDSYRATALQVGTITGSNVSLQATGAGYNLIGHSVSATGNLTLQSGSQIGESGSPITIDYGTLTPITVTNYIIDLTNQSLEIVGLNLEAFGRALTYANGLLSFTGNVRLQAITGTAGVGLLGSVLQVGAGNITLDASITGAVYLSSSGAVTLTTPNALMGDLTGTSLSLTAASIGSSADLPLTTHTPILTIVSTGDFYVHNDQSLSLQGASSSAGGGQIQTTGNIDLQANVAVASNLTLEAAGNITNSGNATISGNDTHLALEAGGSISGLIVDLSHPTESYLTASAGGSINISSNNDLILGGASGQIIGSSINISSTGLIGLRGAASNVLSSTGNVILSFDTFSNINGGEIQSQNITMQKISGASDPMRLGAEMQSLINGTTGATITFDANGQDLNVDSALSYGGYNVNFYGRTLTLGSVQHGAIVTAENMTIGLNGGWATNANNATVDVQNLWIYDLGDQTVVGGSASNAFNGSVLNSLVKTPTTANVTVGFGSGKNVLVSGGFAATWAKLILQGSTVDLEARATLGTAVEVITDNLIVGSSGEISAPEVDLTKLSTGNLVVGSSDFITSAQLESLVQSTSGVETLVLTSSGNVELQNALDLTGALSNLRIDIHGTSLSGNSGSPDLSMSSEQELHLYIPQNISLETAVTNVFFEESTINSLSLTSISTTPLMVYGQIATGTNFTTSFNIHASGDVYTRYPISVDSAPIVPITNIATSSGSSIYFDGIRVFGGSSVPVQNSVKIKKGSHE